MEKLTPEQKEMARIEKASLKRHANSDQETAENEQRIEEMRARIQKETKARNPQRTKARSKQ